MSVQFIREIFRGGTLLDPEHFQSVFEVFKGHLEAGNKRSDLTEEYANCRTDLERIRFFQKFFEWIPIPLTYFTRFQKSAEVSSSFREVGNTAYKVKDISNAFRGYNLALAFAPSGSEEEGLAYSNRSALLMLVAEYKLALSDVELALGFGLNKSVTEKLLARRAKCSDEERKIKIGNCNVGEEFFEQRFSSLKSPHLKIKGAGDFVEIGFSPECGRRLLATRDIQTGVPIVIDEGYATVLERLLNWDTEHCAFCTKPVLAGIPNPLTTFGLYCNTKCLQIGGETISKYEHSYISYMHSSEAFHDDESLLILRILSKTGPNELYKRWQKSIDQIPNENDSEKTIPGMTSDGIYDPSTFETVYSLIPHPSESDFDNVSKSKEFKSIFLSHILGETTPFFENIATKDVSNFKDYIASLILRHFESLEYNVLSLCEWRTGSGPLSQSLWLKDAKSKSRETKTTSYGTGVYPLVALCNHSCDPNAVFVKGAKVNFAVLLSSRLIRKGDEITISYKAPFTRMPFEERQIYLRKNYKFSCRCFACEHKFSVDSTTSKPVSIFGDSDGIKVVDENSKENLKGLMEAELELEEVKKLIRDERFFEAFDCLVAEANFLSRFQSNFKLTQICQDLFRRVVVHIMHL